MRVLGLVPARGGSQRTPGKNLERLEGRTLVRRALETALASGVLDTVALSSEDPAIRVEAAGLAVAVVERPLELAGDEVATLEVVLHTLGELEPERGRFDAVAVIQCTSPFTAPEDVVGAIELLERTGAPSVVSIVRVEASAHPLKLKVLEGDRLRGYLAEDKLTLSQALPPLWIRNGSIYVSRREVLDRGVLLAEDLRGYVMPPERSLDIDTPLDLAFARFLVERR